MSKSSKRNGNGATPPDARAGREHGVGALGRDRLPAQAQVVRQPEIVVVQVGDVLAPAELEADVVRPGLLTGSAEQIDERHAIVVEAVHHGFGVVGATVTDDDQLPRLERLPDHAFDRVPQDPAAVVRRGDDRDRRVGDRGVVIYAPGCLAKGGLRGVGRR